MANELTKNSPKAILAYLQEDKQRMEMMAAALGSQKAVKKFMLETVTLLTIKPELMELERGSLITTIINGVTVGLPFEPAQGLAYIIPRWDKKNVCMVATYQPSYRGWLRLAYDSGRISTADSGIVRMGDEFD